MAELVDVMVHTMGSAYPELPARADFIRQVIREEELAFLRTLESGLKRLDIALADSDVLSGERAFELYDTFGFPLDLTSLICREQGKSVDEKGFALAMEAQKTRSRQASAQKVGDWTICFEGPADRFVGYDQLEATGQLLRYRSVETAKGPVVQACFEPTPFYPEGGGQVGDQGWVEFGGERIEVLATTKETGMILHTLAAACCTTRFVRYSEPTWSSAVHWFRPRPCALTLAIFKKFRPKKWRLLKATLRPQFAPTSP